MPKIVLVGQDIGLLETRAAVLKKIGAEVVYCVGSQALNVIAVEMPDLLVLCHSLTHEEAAAIAESVHTSYPTTRILLVVSQVITERPHEDLKIDATSLPEPTRLIARATELLRGLPSHHVREIIPDSQGPATL